MPRCALLPALPALLALMAAPNMSLAQSAEEGHTIEKITLDEMALAELKALPGVSSGFVLGTFDTNGLYAVQGVMREGAVFPPHAHPDTRLTVVVSGTMYLGQGATFDKAALVAYPEGTVAITSADTFHFMAAPDGDVSVLEIGSGPSGVTMPETD